MKVYVIEMGCYSDRHIVGVVETEEEAKRICNNISEIDDWDADTAVYTEYDTKQFQSHRMRFVVIHDGWDGHDEWNVSYDDYDIYANYKTNTQDYEDHFIIYANSRQQAIKIAQDMYYESKAKKEGIAL